MDWGGTSSLLVDGSISVIPAPAFTTPHLDDTPGAVTSVGGTAFINAAWWGGPHFGIGRGQFQ
jgi:hypothetical protein